MNYREKHRPHYLPRGVAPDAAAALLWGTADLWRKEVMRSVDPFWVAVVSGVLVCAAMWRSGEDIGELSPPIVQIASLPSPFLSSESPSD